ncbi:MAG: hypothetical protein KGD72_12525, partial [Candidatus Lokiarchaeota archaeon]|nr:hypothetical protein [Candidatus Lokiarchaeota archaeon]
MERDDMNKEKDREVQIKVAMIHARDNDTNAQLNLEKGMRDLEIKEQDLALKQKQANETERSNRSGEAIKRKDSDNKVKISKSKSRITVPDMLPFWFKIRKFWFRIDFNVSFIRFSTSKCNCFFVMNICVVLGDGYIVNRFNFTFLAYFSIVKIFRSTKWAF